MKEKAPHMPWYGREFYSDENVQVMTLEQEAAYLRFQWNCWQEGSIPNDVTELAAICKNTPLRRFKDVIWPRLAGHFAEMPDNRLVHTGVETLRAAKNRYREESVEAGKRGAEVRWGSQRTTSSLGGAIVKVNTSLEDGGKQSADSAQIGNATTTPQNGDRVPIPVDCRLPIVDNRIPNIHTHSVRETPTAADLNGPTSSRFEEFWEDYPRKQRKDAACSAWLSVVTPDNEAAVFACLKRYLASDEVARAVVANPDKWLYEQHRNGWAGTWPTVRDRSCANQAKERRRGEEITDHWAKLGN